LQSQLKTALETIESLKQSIQNNSKVISETAELLGVKISASEATASRQFQEVDQSVSKTVLYIVIVFLLTLILTVLIYLLLNRRQKIDKSGIIEQISQTKAGIEENVVEQISRTKTEIEENVVEQMNKTKTEIEENMINVCEKMIDAIGEPETIDHSLARKMANEITVIEGNIRFMDQNVRGLKQLKRSINRLRDNLAANGYDVPQLLGKVYYEGMNLLVTNSILDDSLDEDLAIISNVIVPQINYNKKMIQAAEVEISVGTKNDDNQKTSNNN
jgi:hypothetical protein